MTIAARLGCRLLFAVFALLLASVAAAQTDPLLSWNDGAAKKAIIEFVQATTTQGSAEFVPPADRIAGFDQDGTLWVEHPAYSQVIYCLDRVPALVKAKPELGHVEPFKTVMSGNSLCATKVSPLLDYTLSLALHALMSPFLWAAVVVILRDAFSTRVVGAENVLGAICGYIIAGDAWGGVNAMTYLPIPGAYSINPGPARFSPSGTAGWHSCRITAFRKC